MHQAAHRTRAVTRRHHARLIRPLRLTRPLRTARPLRLTRPLRTAPLRPRVHRIRDDIKQTVNKLLTQFLYKFIFRNGKG
jgi:hypothetical protein